MNRNPIFSIFFAACAIVCGMVNAAAVELHPETVSAWNTYVQLTENRITQELNGGPRFLLLDSMKANDAADVWRTLREGRVYIRKLKTNGPDGQDIDIPGGMIHHWYGAVFVPNIRLEALLKAIQDYDHHQRYFPEEVEQSRLLSREQNTYKVLLQLTRTKIVTVHYRTLHTVEYKSFGEGMESSRSISTQIVQLENAGTPRERALPEGRDDGYFWRLNSYWRFKAQDNGVIVECESICLSRSIPFGLGWLIGGAVESVPRESFENALGAIRDRVR
jgi:hypothetical protein